MALHSCRRSIAMADNQCSPTNRSRAVAQDCRVALREFGKGCPARQAPKARYALGWWCCDPPTSPWGSGSGGFAGFGVGEESGFAGGEDSFGSAGG